MSGFVHLHLHTEYSLLDGAAVISRIADKAKSDGQTAVAITDHGVMYGAVAFYDELTSKGIKPIIGCEVYVAPRSMHLKEGKSDSSGNHLILLCKNSEGYKNLCYMVSQSFINGFYMKPRIDMELLRAHSEGLIALSGCVAGKIPQLILGGSMAEAEKAAIEMKSIFGDDFYLEIQNHGIDEEFKVCYGLRVISENLGIPLVATNDVHYIDRSDAEMQATLICIQTNSCITDGRPLGFEKNEFYFKTEKEMRSLFPDCQAAIDNTVTIADKCNFDFEFNKLHLPDFHPDNNRTHAQTLRDLAYSGYEAHKTAGRFDFSSHPEEIYTDRIEYELSVIDRMGFNAYYLIVSDFVGYAKKNGIPVGPGRGSGAGSLVAFCIGITDVDPIAFDLLFERFLNPERVSMPDFDIDFCYNRREEVIEYVKRRYGENRVAQIVTFGTLGAKAAVRDVGRALGMPYSKVDSVAKLFPRATDVKIDEALKARELFELYESDPEVRRLINISKSLEGLPRHASTHAAGVVITQEPTYEYVPLSSSGTGVVVQFDMNTSARLGLVKFDFLGLRYITVISDAEREIRKRIPDFDISKVRFDDKKTFDLLCAAQTDGIFQLESAGMKQVLARLQPSALEDIIAVIALYRPGPMDSIDTFIARKHGAEPVKYLVPELEDILDVTYGCIVYQEQVMQICRKLAGYSYARADIVRRAMSKKKEEAMLAEQKGFIDGCAKNGIQAEVASEIFQQMKNFAKYAFNKSHATAYSVISYRTAYLKAHYPAEYFAALFTSVLDNSSKLKEYIADAQKMGIKVLPPDINLSNPDFSVVDGNIRFGLLAIKNVGYNLANAVIKERNIAEFKNFDEFVCRLSSSDINKRTLEAFIKCGVFDTLGVTRSALLSVYEGILESEQNKRRNNIIGQIDWFSLGENSISSDTAFVYPDMEEFSQNELLLLEKESSGMYFSGHMIDNYTFHIASIEADSILEIITSAENQPGQNESKYVDGAQVTVAGIITAKKTKTLKNGDVMAFVTVEDRLGEIEVIVFAKLYSKFSRLLVVEGAVIISGKLSYDDRDKPEIVLSNVQNLIDNSVYSEKTARKENNDLQRRIFIKLPEFNENRLVPIYRISALNPGTVEIVVYDAACKKYVSMKNVRIDASEKVVNRLKSLYGDENVILR